MREIKFRAWDRVYKHFHEGDIVREYILGDFLDDPNYEVSQYTGLKDKNGQEIYEGDFVVNHRNRYSQEVLQVRWQEGEDKQSEDGVWWTPKKPGFVFERVNPGMHTCFVAHKDFEVIGNIYENPELLNEN